MEVRIRQPERIRTMCPKCGWESTKGYATVFRMNGKDIDYCTKCLGEWFKQNIPEMVEEGNHEPS